MNSISTDPGIEIPIILNVLDLTFHEVPKAETTKLYDWSVIMFVL